MKSIQVEVFMNPKHNNCTQQSNPLFNLFACFSLFVLMLNINLFISIIKFSILIALTLKYPWLVFIVYTIFSVKKEN